MEKYNGYTNRETWLVNLWIDNEYGWLDAYLNHVIETEADKYDLADYIEADISEELNPLVDKNGLYSDLLNGALSKVNWLEIAEYIIEYAKEE